MLKNKESFFIYLWMAWSCFCLVGIYLAETYAGRPDVKYPISAFLLGTASLLLWLAVKGAKTGIIYFGRGGPTHQSLNPSLFWFTFVLAVGLGGTCLIAGIGVLLDLN